MVNFQQKRGIRSLVLYMKVLDKNLKTVCAAVLFALGLMYLVGLTNNLMDYDEGAIYLYPNMLYKMGFTPYVDFTYGQPPALLFLPRDLLSARFFSVLCVFVSAGAIYLTGKRLGVGIYASIFFMSCPLVMEFGRLAVGDAPVIALFSVILYLMMLGSNWLIELFLIGVLFFAAFMVKIQIAIPVGFMLLYMIFIKKEANYTVSLVVCAFLCIGAFSLVPGLLQDVIINNLGGYDIERAILYLVNSVAQFIIKGGAMLMMFSAYGLYAMRSRFKERNVHVLLSIVFSAVIVCVAYSWLNYRHFMYLIPVMSVFAGYGLKSFKNKEFAVIVLLVAVLNPIYELNRSMNYDQATRDIAKNITAMVPAGEMIYTDQPMLAHLSNRTMPNTAQQWNGMGRLQGIKADDVINDIKDKTPAMVLLVTGTPSSMEQPRLISTFGNNSIKILNFLDESYKYKDYYRRDWQLIRVWKRNDTVHN